MTRHVLVPGRPIGTGATPAVFRTTPAIGGGAQGPAGPPGPQGRDGAGGEGANVLTYGAVGDGVADDTAAFAAAEADTEKSSIYVPDGLTCAVGALTITKDIRFGAGASLALTAAEGVIFNRVRQRICGLRYTIGATSSTFAAVTVAGANSIVEECAAQVTGDAPNCTLLSIQGEQTHLYDLSLTSVGKAFKYGLHIVASGGGELHGVSVDGLKADVGDDGEDVAFGALVYWRGQLSRIAALAIDAGGRAGFPDGVVIVDGHRNVLVNPKIWAQNAKYGVYRTDGSEFFTVEDGQIQGRVNGTYYADAEGVYSGHAAGHLKLRGTAINGWEHATGIHGTHDTPVLDGAVLANNKTSAVFIDAKIGTDEWPVSGLMLSGCYGEAQATGSDQIYVYVKSGALRGAAMMGCWISNHTRLFKSEAAITAQVGIYIEGNRFSGVVGNALLEPGSASTVITWGLTNNLHQIDTLSTDDSKVVKFSEPVLESLVVGAKDSSTANNRVTRRYTDLYTANFGNVSAGATVELDFAYATVPTNTTAGLRATMGGSLGAKAAAGIIFQWWINASGHIHGSATNITGSTINSVSGGVRFEIDVYG